MKIYYLLAVLLYTGLCTAQQDRRLQFDRMPGYQGLHVFETSKDTAQPPFDGLKIRVGGDFALQFQALRHSTGHAGDTLVALGNNFNLPSANLNIAAQLAEGVRMNLVTYLSSRHHNESWVKGGYIQVDKLDFIRKDFLSSVMKIVTIRAGMDEINYGDAHFRRTDNARAIYNAFVGNYIMDAFTTEIFGEVYAQYHGFLAMAAISNGNLNQTAVKGSKDPFPSYYGKLGFDKTIRDQVRIRLTGSAYFSPGYDNGQYLYSGDRAGSRYYNVMQLKSATTDNFRSGGFNPGFWKYQSFQLNPFVKWRGAELFGVYEITQGDQSRTKTGGMYTQAGAELIYRFTRKENVYAGIRYNQVAGRDTSGASGRNITRLNVAAGWYLTHNVLFKAEYVTQEYSGDAWKATLYEGGKFNGVMLEAVIGF